MQWQCCCQSGVLVLLRCIDSKGTHLPRKENSDCLNRFAPPATTTTTRCWLYRRTRCPENARASWASGSFRFQTASAPEKTHSSKVKRRKCIADVCCVQGPFPARICCGFWLVRDLHPVRDHWSSAPREGVYLPRLKHVIDTPLFHRNVAMGAGASSAIHLKKIPVLKASRFAPVPKANRFAPERQMDVSELEEES